MTVWMSNHAIKMIATRAAIATAATALTLVAGAANASPAKAQFEYVRVRLPLAASYELEGSNLKTRAPTYKNVKQAQVKHGRVIASLDLETYLKGVLPAEMPASWPIEALKAQAVAARTFALYRQQHSAQKDFDLDSNIMDQVFAAETAKPTDKAIDETNGEVLTMNNELVAAYFHADCGGHTEDAHNVWGTQDSAGTTKDDGCPFNPRATWKLKLSLAQISAKLHENLSRIETGATNESGRVTQVALALQDGRGLTISGNDFRSKLGFDLFRSTAFTITRNGDEYTFTGRGYGHGVGLCQWGARQMAKAGKSYRDILAHYYPRARLWRDPRARLDRHPNLDNEERDGANNKQAANFHKGHLYSLTAP